ncbi:hypothetical protein COEREDRAFT_82552 [Coemansia reversa NRRL 1564]|uniref:COP9 signalosome complex subunit 4 n=1 Tax=Coemansia reversa (strain ATCC 12441 / NRRL 1564) TaxID=763665 RepID=A0A2G5B6P6_COERN|nr:hypothetical protein COEREDRAFT_82552 [Coemansia reversa NRRL 1564]|eukprot:PIA14664.1 hypothetical protein COEREDRAFT_82552 [Coemansia reversa NRRL 1564]
MVDACVVENVAQTISSVVLSEIVNLLSEASQWDIRLTRDACRESLNYLVNKVPQRGLAYEEVISNARAKLCNILTDENRLEEAAEVLYATRFENSQRTDLDQYRFSVYLHAMDLFLRAGNWERAEQVHIRASALDKQINDVEARCKYNILMAQLHELKGKYIEAATRYHGAAQFYLNRPNEQRELLQKAIACAVLASAGPQKMRVMANLQREKLASTLPSYEMLKKMVLKRLVTHEELEVFNRNVRDGRKADSLRTVVCEHNVFVLSSLYSNIRFDNLGNRLGVNSEDAEQICAQMIAEGRMKGRIDQIEAMITFEGARDVQEVSAGILKKQTKSQPPPMHFRETIAANWDERIVNLCTTVESAVDLLIERQPRYTQMLFRREE